MIRIIKADSSHWGYVKMSFKTYIFKKQSMSDLLYSTAMLPSDQYYTNQLDIVKTYDVGSRNPAFQ